MPYTSPQNDSDDKPSADRGGFGTGSLTLLVVASMIGSGVFTTSGFTLGAVGSPSRVLLCWLIAGGVAICGSIAYGQLARLMPQSGGEYLYLSRNVHPVAGFLAGWVSLTAGFSGAIAFAAVAFERYALPQDVRPDWLPADSVSILLILLCAFTHGWRPELGKVFQNLTVGLKVMILCGFLAFAAYRLPGHNWHVEMLNDAPEAGMPLITAMATSLVWISLSYAGFNAAIYVASESPEAGRRVPHSLWLGTVLVTMLYLVLNAIFVTSVPGGEMAWQESVAAISAAALGGKPLEILIRTAVCLGLFTSISGMIVTGPRVYSRMADDDVFPRMFAAGRGGIPRSIGLQAAISVALIVFQQFLVNAGMLRSSLLGLLIYLGTTLSISSACCALTLFAPQVRRQMTEKSVGRDIATAVYALFTLAAVGVMIISHQEDGESRSLHHVAGVVVTLVSGLIAWAVVGRRRKG